MRRTRIYIAGPYTKPDPIENTHRAFTYGNKLWDAGCAPFIPHLTAFWHLVTPRPYEQWLQIDLEWLHACDAVYRFPGESSGADAEVATAHRAGIRVFFELGALLQAFCPGHPCTRFRRKALGDQRLSAR